MGMGIGWSIDPSSPWHDVSSAFDEIISAGAGLVKAWHDDGGAASRLVRTSIDGYDDDDVGLTLTEEEEREFRSVYAEWATNAFGDELDALRCRGEVGGSGSSSLTTTSATSATSATDVVDGLDPTRFSIVAPSTTRGVVRKGDVGGGEGGGSSSSNSSSPPDAVTASSASSTTTREIIDVRVLSDMLTSGSDVLTAAEKRMLLGARRRWTKTMTSDIECIPPQGLTLHELRKRKIGFLGVNDVR
ncbi:hypothetical protein ACHAXA_000114 [Cyclostephanos tholiformis]|uniref:Uncharacterized protein n=1 Tax=Cyclostephanos tholiformis TaxID=382380 RepID=A0ABD3RXU4_9STRA